MTREGSTPYLDARDAIEQANVPALRAALQSDPSLVKGGLKAHFLLVQAASLNSVPLLAALVEAGADVNTGHSPASPEGPIEAAADAGALEAARWLLDRGARINFQVSGATRCSALVGAIQKGHLPMVRLLVERGADFNAVWAGKNAISWAAAAGRQEIADYLRSKGALEPQQFAASKAAPASSAIREHLQRHLGTPHALSLREIVPPGGLPVTVHRIDLPTRHVLVTEGMSARPMTVPVGEERYQYAEVLINLPLGWPLDDKALAAPETSWPIHWLRRIARYPHEHGTWLGGHSVIIANGEPPQPLAPNTRLTCLLAITEQSDFGWLRTPDGRLIAFYSLYPLYTEERDLERRAGAAHLLRLFAENDISMTVDLHRPNVALPG